MERLLDARPRRPHRRRRHRLRHPARRADAARRRLHRAGQVAAPAARQAPRPARRRDPLPPARARPDGQRGGARALRHARQDRLGRAPLPRRARLRRGRDARPAAALRRRAGAPVHHALQRAGPRLLPADRDRAVPQAPDRRRARAGLRARQGLPQRGHLLQAQPRVHDGRVVRGLRRLRGHDARRRGALPARRRRRRLRRRDRLRATPYRRVGLIESIQEATGIDVMAHPDRRRAGHGHQGREHRHADRRPRMAAASSTTSSPSRSSRR